jgi:hypothetical protein
MPTPCEEAAQDLADIKAAIKAITTGTRVTGWRHGDKSMDFYAGGNVVAMFAERRRLQAIVNRCNGVSSPFIQNTPSDC